MGGAGWPPSVLGKDWLVSNQIEPLPGLGATPSPLETPELSERSALIRQIWGESALESAHLWGAVWKGREASRRLHWQPGSGLGRLELVEAMP